MSFVADYEEHEQDFFPALPPRAGAHHDGWGINPWTGRPERWPEQSRQRREAEMGRYAKESGSTFQEVPPDTYAARFYKVVDLGTSVDKFSEEGRKKSRVMIAWELDHPMADGRPFTIAAFVTNSLSEKATLRQWLEQVRGRPFSRDELKGFDLSKVIGVPCLVTVALSEKSGKSRVAGVTKLPKGLECPPLKNEPFVFFLDEFDEKKFASLPDGLQKSISESDEYKALHSKPDPARHFDDMPDDIPETDSVPF